MATSTPVTPAIGVLDADGLYLSDGSLAPVTGAIRHVGDLYNGARRRSLTQLWLTDAWVRAAGSVRTQNTRCYSPLIRSRPAAKTFSILKVD